MVTGLVTIKPGRSLPGKSVERPRDAGTEASSKPAEKSREPLKPQQSPKAETKPETRPLEKAPEPGAVPIPKEPDKPKSVERPKEPEKKADKPEAQKKPETKKTPAKKDDDLAGALASLGQQVKRDEKGKSGGRRDAVAGALDDLKKQQGGPGEGGPGMGSGGDGDGVGALGSYVESVISRVKPNWSYVEPANRRNFTAVVNIRIDKDGTIREARIVEPSGNPYFDGTVMSAIRVTARLEPPDSPEMMDLNIAFSPDALRGR